MSYNEVILVVKKYDWGFFLNGILCNLYLYFVVSIVEL